MRRINSTNSRKQLIRKLLLFVALGFAINAQAQVTIGSGIPPVSGALLDLKEYASSDPVAATGISATKGLGLPRVSLQVSNLLLPMFDGADATNYYKDGTAYPKATEDAKHIGLTLYNLTEDSSQGLKTGVCFWDGSQWIVAGKSGGDSSNNPTLSWFYMPTFVLDTSGPLNTEKTINLYTQYATQFTNVPATNRSQSAPANVPIFIADELNYYVLGYDADVLKINSIGDEGELKYEIKSAASPLTYINVVFTVK